jgi:capsular polysaccharide biosynthesis protein
VHAEPVETHPTYRRIRLPKAVQLPGRTLLLTSAYGGSFYHWLVDALPRIALTIRAGVQLRGIDQVLLPAESGPYIEQALSRFPELRARRVVVNDDTHVQCDELIAPSLPHPVGDCAEWVPGFLRDTFLAGEEPASSERLFLSRATAPRRRLLNEDAIWSEILCRAGFTRVALDTLPLAEQARLVSRAAFVVAPHGASLTHMAFARPGCQVVELLSSTYPATCFWNLADAAGHSYRYVVCPAEGSGHEQARDFRADPQLVAGAVERCLETAA